MFALKMCDVKSIERQKKETARKRFTRDWRGGVFSRLTQLRFKYFCTEGRLIIRERTVGRIALGSMTRISRSARTDHLFCRPRRADAGFQCRGCSERPVATRTALCLLTCSGHFRDFPVGRGGRRTRDPRRTSRDQRRSFLFCHESGGPPDFTEIRD